MRYYPVFLDLAGQPCIVVGDGKFAIEKAAGLREAGALVRVIASRDYKPGDLHGAREVFPRQFQRAACPCARSMLP